MRGLRFVRMQSMLVSATDKQTSNGTLPTTLYDAEDTRKPHPTSGTSSGLSYAMVADDVRSRAESSGMPAASTAMFPGSNAIVTKSVDLSSGENKAANVVLITP